MCNPIPLPLQIGGDMNTATKHFVKRGVLTWRGEICSSPLSRMETGWAFSCRAVLVSRVFPAVQTQEAPDAVHSPYAGRVGVLFISLCCHIELPKTHITAQRLKVTYFVHPPMLLMLPVVLDYFSFNSCWLRVAVRMHFFMISRCIMIFIAYAFPSNSIPEGLQQYKPRHNVLESDKLPAARDSRDSCCCITGYVLIVSSTTPASSTIVKVVVPV